MRKQLIFSCFVLFISSRIFSQNVGIGTKNPYRAKLEVHGGVEATAAIFGGDTSGVSVMRNWPGIGFNTYFNAGLHRLMSKGFGAMMILDPNNGYLAVDMMPSGQNGSYTGTRRTMVITNEGRVNIGPAAPYSNFNVARGVVTPFYATASFEGTTHHSHFNYGPSENSYIRAGKDNGTVFINDIPNATVAIGGMVGINTATPGSTLEIRQNKGGLTLVDPAAFNNWELLVSSSLGWLHLFRNGTLAGRFYEDGRYGETSDVRLKTDITPLPSLLGRLLQLTPVEYRLKDAHSNHKTIGFIAQDVKKLFPGIVRVEQDSSGSRQGIKDLHTLNYSDFGVLAIKAIQEQQTIIETLSKKIAALEGRLDAIK
jgi:hypothetical protein